MMAVNPRRSSQRTARGLSLRVRIQESSTLPLDFVQSCLMAVMKSLDPNTPPDFLLGLRIPAVRLPALYLDPRQQCQVYAICSQCAHRRRSAILFFWAPVPKCLPDNMPKMSSLHLE